MELHPLKGGLKVYQIRASLFLSVFWAFSELTLHLRLLPLSPHCVHYRQVMQDDGCESHRMLTADLSSSEELLQLFGTCDMLSCCGPEEWTAGAAATTHFSVFCSTFWQLEGRELEERQMPVTINNTTGFVVLLNVLALLLPALQFSWDKLCGFLRLPLKVMEAHAVTEFLPCQQNLAHPTRKK